jgi:hypothetical protein
VDASDTGPLQPARKAPVDWLCSERETVRADLASARHFASGSTCPRARAVLNWLTFGAKVRHATKMTLPPPHSLSFD